MNCDMYQFQRELYESLTDFDASGWEWYCPDRWVPHCTIALTGDDEENAFFEQAILRQFRHISFHTGMLNGQTAVSTGEFPMWVSETEKYVDDGNCFGRYRKGKITL